HGSHWDSSGSGPVGCCGAEYSWVDFTFAHTVRDVISSEELIVTVAAGRGGGVAIRSDADVTWIYPRASSETIPAGVAAIYLYVNRVYGKGSYLTNVIRSTPTVRALVRLFDRAPNFPPGTTIL